MVLASCGGAVGPESSGATDAGAAPPVSPPPPQPALPDAGSFDASSGGDAGSSNVVFEDGFEGENGPCAGWTTTHATVNVVAGGHTGQYACRVCTLANGGGGVQRRADVSLPAGSRLALSAYALGENGMRISWSFAGDGFAPQAHDGALQPAATWIELVAGPTPPLQTPVKLAYVLVNIEAAGACLLLDDVRLFVE